MIPFVLITSSVHVCGPTNYRLTFVKIIVMASLSHRDLAYLVKPFLLKLRIGHTGFIPEHLKLTL